MTGAGSSTSELLRVEGLTVAYGAAKPVLTDLTVELSQGEILVLVGESGSGKSTLLRAILGVLADSAQQITGTVSFRGKEVCWQARKPSCVRGRDIAMLFQHPTQSLNPSRRVGSQFHEYLAEHTSLTRSERAGQIKAALADMHLDDAPRLLKAYPFELSGGMMQRVCLAMAMSLHPPVLLADEPTSALDVVTQRRVADELIRLNRESGTSVILVTHNMALADRIADRIGVMRDGRIVELGEREQVVRSPRHDYTKALLKAVS